MQKNKSVTINGKSYKLKSPTVGQYQTLQALKMQYTRDKYGELVRSGTVAANISLDYADAFAHIHALFPEVLSTLKVQTYEQLEADDALELVKIYKKHILPFMQEWEKIFTKPDKDEGDEDPLEEREGGK